MDIKKLVSKMTLEEKAAMCSGADFWHTKKVERLDIPTVQVSDGPHGLRTQGGRRRRPSRTECFHRGCVFPGGLCYGMFL